MAGSGRRAASRPTNRPMRFIHRPGTPVTVSTPPAGAPDHDATSRCTPSGMGRSPASVAQAWIRGEGDPPAQRRELARFRQEFYTSLTLRADALFELTDAVLCADGPVRSLVDLTLVAEHRRGHGAMYDALNQGRVEPAPIRRSLASLPLPRATDGRLVLAVDVSPWLRSDAPTSA